VPFCSPWQPSLNETDDPSLLIIINNVVWSTRKSLPTFQPHFPPARHNLQRQRQLGNRQRRRRHENSSPPRQLQRPEHLLPDQPQLPCLQRLHHAARLLHPAATWVQPGYAQSYYQQDGCNVIAGSMPGGNIYGYSQGKTTVHEVGHWFGLLHTFQDNTCNPSDAGDMIADTPQQSIPTNGCPVGKDSCPNSPGLDPINNYMDYSIDAW